MSDQLTAFPSVTFSSELQDGSHLGSVTLKEFQQLVSQIEGFLRAAGFNADGSFNQLTVNNLTAQVINIIGANGQPSGAVLLIASRRLNDTQIKSLPTIPVELRKPDGTTSSPGVGFVCVLIKWVITLDNRNGAYAGMNNAELRLVTGTVVQANTPTVDAMFGNQGVWTIIEEPLLNAVPFGFNSALAENSPWLAQMLNGANLTGGDSRNFLTEHAWYVLAPITSTVASSPINWTTTGQLVAPPAAAGVSITPSGTANAFSAWVEVTAATVSDWLLTGISTVPGAVSVFSLQVGVGGAGAEVTIAEMMGHVDDSLAVVGNSYMIWPVPINAIPNGSRVAVRLRKTGTDTTAWLAALTYLPVPAAGNVDSSPEDPAFFNFSPTATFPPASWGGSSAWIPQGYATESLLVWGCRFTPNTDSVDDFEIDVGVGAPGSERVIATIRSCIKDNAAVLGGGMHWLPFKPVVDGINIGDLVSVRTRKSGTGSTIDWTVWLMTTGTTGAPYALLTQQASVAIPANITSVGATTAGSAWANGSWVTVLAQLPEDTGIQTLAFFANSAGSYEVDLGYGDAGSEVVAGTVRFQCKGATSGDANHMALPYAIVLPARKRFAMRLRGTATSQSVQIGFTATYSPTFDQRTSVTSGAFPAAANNKTVAGKNSAWGNSNWVQLVNSVGATDVFIHSICYSNGVASVEFEIDLGVGAAASEVVLTTVRSSVGSNALGYTQIPLYPPVKVVAGTALSARFRKPGTDTTAWEFAVSYFGNVLA